MARRASTKTTDQYTHPSAKRVNLPTEQTGKTMSDTDRRPILYQPETREIDDEPILAWNRQPANQDGHAAHPLYVREKVHPAAFVSGSELRLEKFPFSRHVIDVVTKERQDWEPGKEMRSRFGSLFRHLTAMQRKADRERDTKTIVGRVERERSRFLRDHPSPTKADLKAMLERIEAVVDEAEEGDQLLTSIRRLKDDYQLSRDLSHPIEDQEELKRRLQTLQYDELRASQSPSGESGSQ